MQAHRILIVDDGFEVFEAADGASAIEVARKQLFDVVLTDLHMPPPDGLGVLKEVRRIHPDTAILILTAYALPDNEIKALELGCDGVISKPVDLERLRGIVHQSLMKRKWERMHLSGWY
jgi:CheY-like chemotaxis protein